MRLLFIIMLSISISIAEDINEQIKSLEEATPQERVELMNHIKEQLIEMNQHERMNTIEKLRSKLHPPEKGMGVEVSQRQDKDKPQEAIKEEHRNSETKAGLKHRDNPPREMIKERIIDPEQEMQRPKENLEPIRDEFEHLRENNNHPQAPLAPMRGMDE